MLGTKSCTAFPILNPNIKAKHLTMLNSKALLHFLLLTILTINTSVRMINWYIISSWLIALNVYRNKCQDHSNNCNLLHSLYLLIINSDPFVKPQCKLKMMLGLTLFSFITMMKRTHITNLPLPVHIRSLFSA